MKHIGFKLFTGFLCMAILTVVILWIVQAGIMKDSYLTERVNAVDAAVQKAIENNNIDYQALEESLTADFIMLDNRGDVEYISPGTPMRGMIIGSCQSMSKQGEEGIVQYINSMAGNTRYAILGRPLKQEGYLYAVFSLTNVEEASRILRQQLWIVTIALLAISIVFAIILSRKFARPIREVTGAARSMAAGKLNVKLPVRSKDEIGQLTLALNDLGEQLQKTESLRKELIANVSHELRAPLSVIQGYAETVRDVTWPYAEKRTEQLTMITNEAARLSRIVTDILDYSRLQAGVEKLTVSDFSVLSVLQMTVKRHELDASYKDIAIKLNCEDAIIRFDRYKFEQVVDNLLNNAINHAEQGSGIEIKIEQTSDISRIFIKNRGEIIPKDELAHIWDRYYRAQQISENRRLGTGLGLAIVKSILEIHGVTYGVASADSNTEFWFDTLPIE